ncbi:MAG: hypothetical protein Q9182_005540 [Xanthomendoza sp. 2 TL-2023]
MGKKLHPLSLLLVASLAQAAPNVCPEASLIATALSRASISVTPFCSSFLKISTKTATTTATSTPAVSTVYVTSTVSNVITNAVTSTSTAATDVILTTVTSSTTVSVNAAKKRALETPAALVRVNPTAPHNLAARGIKTTTTSSKTTAPTTTTAKVPSCLATFASNIISAGCSCLNIPTPVSTVTVSTTLTQVTTTQTLTASVTSTTTTTAVTAVTATTTSVVVQYTNFCSPTNNYGISYNGGYAALSPSQSGVGATSSSPATDGTAGGCCNACYNAPGCYLFYLDQGSSNRCTLLLTQGGSATDATAQCPSGKLNEYPNSYTPGTGYFGLGACANLAGFS